MTDGRADTGPGRRRHAEHVMGTVVSFDVPAGAGDPSGDGSLGQAVRWLHWVDAIFSPYRDDSDVSRFARGSAAHSVNGGGDVQCVGDRLWRVGIADPLHPGRLALVVAGRDFAVATSGVAERGAHIIDPHTGQPSSGLASITVVGTRLAETAAFATAAFAMGPAARDWVESLAGYEAFAITAAGATWQTSGFGAYSG